MAKKLTTKQLRWRLKLDEDELDIFRRYYLGEVDPECFTPTQREQLERYSKAWSWFCMGRSRSMIIELLKKDYDIKDRQANYDFVASLSLYGQLTDVEKAGRRVASIQYYDMVSQLALKEKNFEAAIKAKKEADQLAGVFDTDEEGWDPKFWEKPSKVVYNVQVVVNNGNQGASNEEGTEIIQLDE